MLRSRHLLLGSGFLGSWLLCLGLGGLLGSRLLGGGFLGSWLLGGLFDGGLLGSLLWRLLGLLGSGLLRGLLGGLGLLWFLGGDLLLGLLLDLLLSELEGAGCTAALGLLERILLYSGAEGQLQVGVYRFLITNLVVLYDVLEDGLSG